MPFVIPTPMAAPPRRPPVLTTAGVALLVLAILHGTVGALGLSLGTSPASSHPLPAVTATGLTATIGILLLALAALELVAGVLVLRLNGMGRILGLILAGVELLQGLRIVGDGQGTAIFAVAVACFLIYALATTGDVFARARRR